MKATTNNYFEIHPKVEIEKFAHTVYDRRQNATVHITVYDVINFPLSINININIKLEEIFTN